MEYRTPVEKVNNELNVETITTEQLSCMLQVCRTKAIDIMASIKSVSDTLGICGIIHKQDYDYWLKQRLGKTKQYFNKGVSADG